MLTGPCLGAAAAAQAVERAKVALQPLPGNAAGAAEVVLQHMPEALEALEVEAGVERPPLGPPEKVALASSSSMCKEAV